MALDETRWNGPRGGDEGKRRRGEKGGWMERKLSSPRTESEKECLVASSST